MGQSQETGKTGEAVTQSWLSSYGLRSVYAGYYSPYDLLCEGQRVEVKTAMMRTEQKRGGAPIWHFNLHRHGVLDESQVDVYIFRLVGFPGTRNALYLVIPAPLRVKTLRLTLRSLIGKYSKYVNNFDAIRPGMGQSLSELEQ